MTTFTNIHVRLAPAELDQTSRLPRLRKLTNDPAREFAQRPGEVEQLPDSVAALILSKQGYSKVSRNGIRVEGVAEKPLNFWSEHSVTIAEKAGTNDKVLWTLNRLKPDVLHILSKDGEYIESIPLEGKVPWFDEAATRKVLGAKTRANNRRIDRVRALHGSDSEAAVAAATENEAALKSIVHTFPHDRTLRKSPGERIDPEIVRDSLSSESRHTSHVTRHSPDLPGQRSNLGEVSAVRGLNKGAETVELPSRAEGRARSSARAAFTARPASDFANAERIHQIQQHLNGRRQSHEERQAVRKSAARFGTAARNDECRTPKAFASGVTNDETRRLSAATTATAVSEDEIW